MSLPKPHEQSFCYRSICFIGLELKLSVMRLYFCLVLPLLRASGKDKTMKRIPKTPIEFDYDLWTTEDGKCMVRVKLTGEVTEVDRDVMRILRTEEKKMRRSYAEETSDNDEDNHRIVLSIDELPDDTQSSTWLADPADFEKEVTMSMLERELVRSLTPKQQGVYFACILGGMSYAKYAALVGTSYQGIQQTVALIRKKAQKIFF